MATNEKSLLFFVFTSPPNWMDAITTLPVSFTLPSRFGTHSNGSVLPLFFRH